MKRQGGVNGLSGATVTSRKPQSLSNKPRAPSAPSCGIAFMAKESTPGRAKTRLVPPLHLDEAADLNTAFLKDVADNVLFAARNSSAGAGIVGYAAFGPPGSEDFFERTLPGSFGLIGAWLPNFGDCLLHTVNEIFARGHNSAVVLNSDSPTLPTTFLIQTAELLARPGDRAVLGPSTDGGYYLLGLKTAHRRMFEDIDWSTERVADQTRQRAREIGLELYELPSWYDVDDVSSLRRLYAELCGEDDRSRKTSAHSPHYAAQTAKLISRLCRDHDFGQRVERVDQVRALRA
jgi:glycosyltransferase A (GT-A) superfamily protein (DUF2064 family)